MAGAKVLGLQKSGRRGSTTIITNKASAPRGTTKVYGVATKGRGSKLSDR